VNKIPENICINDPVFQIKYIEEKVKNIENNLEVKRLKDQSKLLQLISEQANGEKIPSNIDSNLHPRNLHIYQKPILKDESSQNQMGQHYYKK
jgi:hypothetical protein